ncbi:MAG: dienelactone hydrolase family protein [Planctomycetes bacterium]|nr:dienelactone hydrolase family protein [Planctomycetota bacterium]MBI3843650.1 dienelactone hydrolase family protein [Planctomycetota bacterium]
MSPARETEVRIELEDGAEVTGLVAMPAGDPKAGLVLGHGAGGDLSHPLLAAAARGVALEGIAALRFNFPYVEEERGVPDRKPVLVACCRAAFEWMKALPQLEGMPLFAGGKSMGGRMAAIATAGGMPTAGLVFLGYPLHPSARKTELRDEPLKLASEKKVPMLFVQGERDKLCDLTLLEPILAKLTAPCTLHVIPSGDHSLDVPKRSGRTREQIYTEIIEVVCTFVDEVG